VAQHIVLGEITFKSESQMSIHNKTVRCPVKDLGLVLRWRIILAAMIMAHCVQHTLSRTPFQSQ
jgi:hypothetical protein